METIGGVPLKEIVKEATEVAAMGDTANSTTGKGTAVARAVVRKVDITRGIDTR